MWSYFCRGLNMSFHYTYVFLDTSFFIIQVLTEIKVTLFLSKKYLQLHVYYYRQLFQIGYASRLLHVGFQKI